MLKNQRNIQNTGNSKHRASHSKQGILTQYESVRTIPFFFLTLFAQIWLSHIEHIQNVPTYCTYHTAPTVKKSKKKKKKNQVHIITQRQIIWHYAQTCYSQIIVQNTHFCYTLPFQLCCYQHQFLAMSIRHKSHLHSLETMFYYKV